MNIEALLKTYTEALSVCIGYSDEAVNASKEFLKTFAIGEEFYYVTHDYELAKVRVCRRNNTYRPGRGRTLTVYVERIDKKETRDVSFEFSSHRANGTGCMARDDLRRLSKNPKTAKAVKVREEELDLQRDIKWRDEAIAKGKADIAKAKAVELPVAAKGAK